MKKICNKAVDSKRKRTSNRYATSRSYILDEIEEEGDHASHKIEGLEVLGLNPLHSVGVMVHFLAAR